MVRWERWTILPVIWAGLCYIYVLYLKSILESWLGCFRFYMKTYNVVLLGHSYVFSRTYIPYAIGWNSSAIVHFNGVGWWPGCLSVEDEETKRDRQKARERRVWTELSSHDSLLSYPPPPPAALCALSCIAPGGLPAVCTPAQLAQLRLENQIQNIQIQFRSFSE